MIASTAHSWLTRKRAKIYSFTRCFKLFFRQKRSIGACQTCAKHRITVKACWRIFYHFLRFLSHSQSQNSKANMICLQTLDEGGNVIFPHFAMRKPDSSCSSVIVEGSRKSSWARLAVKLDEIRWINKKNRRKEKSEVKLWEILGSFPRQIFEFFSLSALRLDVNKKYRRQILCAKRKKNRRWNWTWIPARARSLVMIYSFIFM